MTSPQANSILATLACGAVVLALITRDLWLRVTNHWAEQKRRDDAGEIPYIRDEERAALIAQHPLLRMKRRGAK